MFFQSLFTGAALVATTLACPLHRRSDDGKTKWAYEASFNWGSLAPEYSACKMGTQQSPVGLSLSNGLATQHIPKLQYSGSVNGSWHNWGYGPAFTLENDGDYTTHPSFTFDNTTAYLAGWHVHTPAEHTVNGHRTKGEMHLVHVNAEGTPVAVLGVRLDPGTAESAFFAQLPEMIDFRNTTAEVAAEMDFKLLMESVKEFKEVWTYQGSLTTPPCTEGIRWFVARHVHYVSVGQMQAVLGASAYGARVEQEVWLHRINE